MDRAELAFGIDPSINNIGIAALDLSYKRQKSIIELCTVKATAALIKTSIDNRLKVMMENTEEQLQAILGDWKDREIDRLGSIAVDEHDSCIPYNGPSPTPTRTHFIIEQPESWGAYKTMASTAKGDLIKLYFATGSIVQLIYSNLDEDDFGEILVHLVPVSKLKGQLPKRIVERRMAQEYEMKFREDHSADALWAAHWIRNHMPAPLPLDGDGKE